MIYIPNRHRKPSIPCDRLCKVGGYAGLGARPLTRDGSAEPGAKKFCTTLSPSSHVHISSQPEICELSISADGQDGRQTGRQASMRAGWGSES